MLVCSLASAWGQRWAWASETPLGTFTPFNGPCSRAADAELPQSVDICHCLWLQCIGTHLPTVCLSLTPFLQPVLLPGVSGSVTLLSSWTAPPLLLLHGDGFGFVGSTPHWGIKERKYNPNHLQSKYTPKIVPSIFNDTLWPAKWWLTFPYNSMVVCAEGGESSSSRHPHFSAAFLKGSCAWEAGLVKPSCHCLAWSSSSGWCFYRDCD